MKFVPVLSKQARCIALGASFAFLLFSAACDPPGKPASESPQEVDRSQIKDFSYLFSSNCSGCHGADGRYGPARILNDPLYLSFIPKEEMRQILIHGRPGTGMPAWAKSEGGPMTDEQIGILVDGIYKSWSKSEQLVGAKLPPYSEDVSKGDPANGKKLFAKDCFACHAKGGLVGPVTEPSYLALASNQLLRTSIVIGRPDFGMPDYRHLNMGRALGDQDITDLVAYLNSLRPPGGRTIGGPPPPHGGETSGATGSHVDENGAGEGRPSSRGNEGSGNGPGSSRHEEREGNKGQGSNSQQGVK
jgi:cytochrome c oxidase cbb3-type subunit III